MKPDCLFCLIAGGQIPSQSVANAERTYAFRDINPAAPVHVLVVPKQHIADSMADLNLADPDSRETWAEMLAVVQDITKGVEFSNGWRLVSNVGEDGRQSVFHLHLHLLAGRLFAWPPG